MLFAACLMMGHILIGRNEGAWLACCCRNDVHWWWWVVRGRPSAALLRLSRLSTFSGGLPELLQSEESGGEGA